MARGRLLFVTLLASTIAMPAAASTRLPEPFRFVSSLLSSLASGAYAPAKHRKHSRSANKHGNFRQNSTLFVKSRRLPAKSDGGSLGTCSASYYGAGEKLARHTANGEVFNPGGMTAAHRTLKFGTMVRVSHEGRSVIVRINDRGPFVGGRCIDLARGAASALGMIGRGVAHVRLEVIR